MNDVPTIEETCEIMVDETFPHAPEVVWKTLTTAGLIGRWLMEPVGFEARKGNRFTYKTTPAGEWDGVIQCEVLEVEPGRRLAYTWKGGHPDNDSKYGSRLETVVTWTLSKVDAGTRLQLVHSGFRLPRNKVAFTGMSKGWPEVLQRIERIADEQDRTKH